MISLFLMNNAVVRNTSLTDYNLENQSISNGNGP